MVISNDDTFFLKKSKWYILPKGVSTCAQKKETPQIFTKLQQPVTKEHQSKKNSYKRTTPMQSNRCFHQSV